MDNECKRLQRKASAVAYPDLAIKSCRIIMIHRFNIPIVFPSDLDMTKAIRGAYLVCLRLFYRN